MEPEFHVFLNFTPNLVTAIQDTVNTIGDECLSRQLISEDARSEVQSQPTSPNKARKLLEVVKNCVKNDPQCYKIFMEILSKELPPQSCKKLLENMKKDLAERKERKEVEQCTDIDGEVSRPKCRPKKGLPTHGMLSVSAARSDRLKMNPSDPKMTDKMKKVNKIATDQKSDDVVQQPIQASESTTPDKQQYLPGYRSTEPPSSARLRTMKSIMEHTQVAIQDAQQDEALMQELDEKLHEAVKERNELKQKLENEQDHLKALLDSKETEASDLKSKLDEMNERLSTTDEKKMQLQWKLEKVESDYNTREEVHSKETRELKEEINKQNLLIDDLGNNLRKEVETLLQKYNDLLKQHIKKDKDLHNERRKSIGLMQKLTRLQSRVDGFSLLAKIVMFIVLILLIFVMIIFAIAMYSNIGNTHSDCRSDL